ncbi:hypothetical protein DC345_11725 [Paenibacillus taichungensis]|uniref:Uncharacterized protein n=2 Tax=Paenibacillus taichungensis TaxID=484184 RepID=A0A329QVH8_9BACL|nr:hypothetical protein DC345_11725 [Paenibacillus taichungensis]
MKIKYIFVLCNLIGFLVYMMIKYMIYEGYAITVPFTFAAISSSLLCVILLIQSELRAIDNDYLQKVTNYRPQTIDELIEEKETWGWEKYRIDNYIAALKANGDIRAGLYYDSPPTKNELGSTQIIGILGITIYLAFVPICVLAALDRLLYIF